MQPEVASPVHASPDEVLVFGLPAIIETWGAVLRTNYRVATSGSAEAVITALNRHSPSLLIADLDASADGTRVCEAAKSVTPAPPTVLVTSQEPENIPAVLPICDGVLLKPFAPNLLSARVARLLRARSSALRVKSGALMEKLALQHAKSQHLLHRSELARQGTNIAWPNTVCPHCAHQGVTSFDFVSHRRAWYACPECRKVWVGRRQEDF